MYEVLDDDGPQLGSGNSDGASPGDDTGQECLTYLALLDIVSKPDPEPLNSDPTKGYI